MNKIQIKKSLNRAINAAPQLSFDELADLPFHKMAEHDYITKQEEAKAPARFRYLAFATACCFLVMISFSGWFVQNRVTDSTITLDVNPSIEIVTNKKDKIISLVALNEDAGKIIEGIDYKDLKLKETIKVLVDSLLSNGYLTPEKRSILLSVKNKNSKKADALLTSLNETIQESLISQNISPTILKQVISGEKGNIDLAKEYHISEGKMKLIQGILASQDNYTLDMLAPMSIEAIVRLAKENSIDLRNLLGYGDDSEDYYDGIEDPLSDEQLDEKDTSSSEEDMDEAGDESKENSLDTHQSDNSSKENNDIQDDQEENYDQYNNNGDNDESNNDSSSPKTQETLNLNTQNDNSEDDGTIEKSEDSEDSVYNNNEDDNSSNRVNKETDIINNIDYDNDIISKDYNNFVDENDSSYEDAGSYEDTKNQFEDNSKEYQAGDNEYE